MGYRNSTEFFNIPVMKAGDVMTEEEEMRQMRAIDSLLYAFGYGCRSMYVDEGVYSASSTESEFRLSITPALANGYAVFGVINGRLFGKRGRMDIDYAMYSGNKYWHYIEYDDGLDESHEQFNVSTYTTEQTTSDTRMLLCTVDIVNNVASIDSTTGKTRSSSIVSHIASSSNPHGSSLSQSHISISGSASLKGNAIPGCIYGSFTTNGSTPVVIAINTSGTIAYVSCTPEDANAGTMACTIDGTSISFTNNGSSGIKANYRVDVV